jgi:haloalkane dehalogenase
VSVYRTPDERFAGLPDWPFEPRYVEQSGLRMHYVDEGGGDPMLLLHGEPTWAFLYRKMIPRLASLRRVVAPDYFGFGRSDKPTDAAWYTYDAHYRSIEEFCDQLGLTRLTIVVQDWGGPLGLRYAVEHEERVERLVILNTGVGGGRAPSEEWLRFREVMRNVGTGIVPSRLVQSGCVGELPSEVLAAYDAPFPTPESRTGVAQFPEQVPVEPEHPNTAKMNAVLDRLRSWEKPALVLFSDSDRIFSLRHAERMTELIPGAELGPPIVGAGHFLQEERGEEIAERVAAWLGE